MTKFDIKGDIAICEDGGFFCHACLIGKLADDASPGPRYCQGCYQSIKDDTKVEKSRDYWNEDGQVFFTGGRGFALTKALQTVDIGKEEDVLKKIKEEK